jgi:hypothetical protein
VRLVLLSKLTLQLDWHLAVAVALWKNREQRGQLAQGADAALAVVEDAACNQGC